MCTHNPCFSKKKKYQTFSNEIIHFIAEKNLCILHEQVFVCFHEGLQSAKSATTKVETLIKLNPSLIIMQSNL